MNWVWRARIEKIIIITLLLGLPIIAGVLVYNWLNPLDFWQKLVSFIVSIGIGIFIFLIILGILAVEYGGW